MTKWKGWRGRDVIAQVKRAAPAGLQKAADLVLQDAQQKAPIDTGELRRSGATQVEHTTAKVSFSADHAIPVHEDMERSYRVGGSKYLEKALAAKKREALEAIAAELQKALR